MNTFSIVRDSLAKTENDPDKVGLDARTSEAGRVIAAVQTVVDALTPPTGGRWIVGFADIQTAGTNLADHRITVSSKPLRDPELSLIEKAVVIATFTAHEIGHTYVTRPRKQPVNLVQEHNAHSGYHSVANIADDIILEPFMVERFPILADAFEFTAGWVLRTTAPELPVRDTLNRDTSAAGRFNIITHATRYGDIPQIEWNDANVIAERDWARDWKRRLLALPLLDHAAFLVLCDEVWDRVRMVDETTPPEPEPEPEPLGGSDDGTNETPSDEDGGDEPGQPGESEDGKGDEPAQGNDFDEDTDDEDGDGEGESDGEDGEGDDGDEPGGDTGGGDSESESDGNGDGDSDGESNGGDWDGESDDSDHDGDDSGQPSADDGTKDGSDQGGDHGDEAGGGGNVNADNTGTIRDEDDFDQSEVDETTHDSAEGGDSADAFAEDAVRTYDSVTSTGFGLHGSMTTEWK